MNIGLGIGAKYPKFNQLSLALRAISVIRRNGGTLIGIPDNALGDGAPNLLGSPEFVNGLADVSTYSGLVAPSTLPGYDRALAFGHDGVQGTIAYKSYMTTLGITYTLSVIVKMDDGNAPTFGAASPPDASNSFALVNHGDAMGSPAAYTVVAQPDGTYRVSCTAAATRAAVNVGIVKYNTNNNRTFRVTGYKLELGSVATAYTPQSVLRQRGTYIDSTGTTPVTAVGDLVGKLNSQTNSNHATQPTTASKPVVARVPKRLGPNLVVNGDFSNGTTGWTPNGMTLSVVSGRLRVFSAAGSSARPYTAFATTPGNQYLVIGEVFPQADAVSLNVGTATGGGSIVAGTPSTTTRTERYTFTATTATTYIFPTAVVTAGGFYELDNIEVREVREWTNAISFDGSNDFLQTGITTGNEGWICAGVTFGGAAGVNETVAESGGVATATNKGIWLFRWGNAGANWLEMRIGNGTSVTTRSVSSVSLLGRPRVAEGGWDTSNLLVGVDGTVSSVARTGDASPSGTVLRLGSYQGGLNYLVGPMTAIIYTPVLPSAADRALIRKWVGSLQGQTL